MANTSTAMSTSRDQPQDELDDLFDYDVDMGDVFQTVDTNMDPVNSTTTTTSRKPDGANGAGSSSGPKRRGGAAAAAGADLGIDETVKVRTRRINVKLDDERLLSDPGIPKLRRMATKKLKFKGKGHEFSDVARLLAFYQFWLDDLFPKAKLADGLAIIEKLGHSRRMQVMRKQWIDEGKYNKLGAAAAAAATDMSNDPQRASGVSKETEVVDITQAGPQTPNGVGQEEHDDDEEDLYSAPPVGARRQGVIERPDGSAADNGGDRGAQRDQIPEEDELDALLADEEDLMRGGNPETEAPQVSRRPKSAAEEQDFDADAEAMAEMEMEW
ncbi:MAG: chromosome segregation in meiosis- protein [Peltula sp. TS41687]|nr:MAG: chromosome segregation in meiosis- protein [Peltula sp. TS41687]